MPSKRIISPIEAVGAPVDIDSNEAKESTLPRCL
jgi:hypothetical protein